MTLKFAPYNTHLTFTDLLDSTADYLNMASEDNYPQSFDLRAFPENSALIIATGDDLKFTEWHGKFAPYAPCFKPDDVLDKTTAESDERVLNAFHIVADKIRTSVESPFSKIINNNRKLSAFLKKVGVDDPRKIYVLSDDRGLFMNPRIGQHPAMRSLIQSDADAEVKEAFEQAEGFPGLRLKEFLSYIGDKKVFIKRAKEIAEEIGVSETFYNINTVMLRPLVPGLLPLPDNGVIFQFRQDGMRFKDIDYTQASVSVLDDVVVPPQYNGKTVAELKKNIDSEYCQSISPTAQIADAFINDFKVPARNAEPISYLFEQFSSIPLVSNRGLGIQRESFKTRSERELVGGYRRSGFSSSIESLGVFEETPYHGMGVIIENHQKTGNTYYDLAKRIEGTLLALHHIILKGFGQFHGAGRPVVIDRDFYEENLCWLHDLKLMGTYGKEASKYFKRYRSMEHLQEKLIKKHAWDHTIAKGNNGVTIPRLDLLNMETLNKLYGLPENFDYGYTVAQLGSASSRLGSAIKDAKRLTYDLCKNGFTTSDGGGTEAVMGAFFDGKLKARYEGHEFLSLSLRAAIVSNKEGEIYDYAKNHGIDLENDPTIKIAELFYLALRQHGVMGPAKGSAHYNPGPGTAYEFFADLYHNLMVAHRGYGIFPGFKTNTLTKDIVVLNSPLNVPTQSKNRRYRSDGQPGCFDAILQSYSDAEWELLNVKTVDTPDQALAHFVKCRYEYELSLEQSSNDKALDNLLDLAI